MKLSIQNVSFNYRSVHALKNVQFELNQGEILSLVGPNGSGKSTLLKCIDGILKPHSGAVFVDGTKTSQINSKELSKIIGYVPQSASSVFPLTVFDVVLAGRKPYMGWSVSAKDEAVVAETMKLLKIEELATRYFNEISGGEQQKVAIARALAQQPKIILLDEPTSNLDIKHQLEVLCIIKSLSRNMKLSVIMAMHDLNLASRYSDKILMLKKGCIYAAGPPETVITEENIMAVYGVKARVYMAHFSKPHVVPLEPVTLREAPEVIQKILS